MKKLMTVFAFFILASSMVVAAPKQKEIEIEIIPGIDIQLKEPQTTGGMSLNEALKNRKTERNFSNEPLDEQLLSDLLWAANGVNRPDGKHTAPSAKNLQEISIYVIMPEGVYYYYPKYEGHFLKRIMKEDLRPIAGNYPLTLVYVADLSQQTKTNAACDCGFIGQNVYLFAAANGLNTVYRGAINTQAIGQKLGLKLGQEVLYGQSIGYPQGYKKDKENK